VGHSVRRAVVAMASCVDHARYTPVSTADGVSPPDTVRRRCERHTTVTQTPSQTCIAQCTQKSVGRGSGGLDALVPTRAA